MVATRPRHALVVCYRSDGHPRPGGHDAITQAWAARALARIKGCEFGGDYDPSQAYPEGGLYFVPKVTLCPVELARGLGIAAEHDLFGGVTPYPFVATKAITHRLPEPDSVAPEGWSHAFGRRVEPVVLPGATAFSLHDARIAGERLLRQGAIRSKDPQGIGGSGQTVLEDRGQLEDFLRAIDDEALARDGIVFERNLRRLSTLSVGRVRVGGLEASYFGTQWQTRGNDGAETYGGSRLVVVRGDFEALLPHAPSRETAIAIEQGCLYHEAALASFPGMFASRCNYDIAQGLDDEGRWMSGVLEQSWRLGGASGAELLALQAMQDDPQLELVRASTSEVFGPDATVPEGAIVCYQGVDEHVGPLTKYAMLEPHADP